MPTVQLLPQTLPVTSVWPRDRTHDICAATRAVYHWTTETDTIPVGELPDVLQSVFFYPYFAFKSLFDHKCPLSWCSAAISVSAAFMYVTTELKIWELRSHQLLLLYHLFCIRESTSHFFGNGWNYEKWRTKLYRWFTQAEPRPPGQLGWSTLTQGSQILNKYLFKRLIY